MFLINGVDPLNWGNMVGLRDHIRQLGLAGTLHEGQLYDAIPFEYDIRRLHREEPDAHFVLIGFSLGANVVHMMAEGSKVTLVFELSRLPLLPGAERIARKPYLTRASTTNAAYVAPLLRKEGKVDSVLLEFFHDAQTSGGLLISVPAAEAEVLVQKCRGRGAEAATIIGEVAERQDAAIVLRP